MCFTDFRPHIKSFEALGLYIDGLKCQLTDIVTNLENKFMGSDLSKVHDTIPKQGVAVSSYFKVLSFAKVVFVLSTRSCVFIWGIQKCITKVFGCFKSFTKLPWYNWRACCGEAFPTFKSKLLKKKYSSALGNILSSLFAGGRLDGYNKLPLIRSKRTCTFWRKAHSCTTDRFLMNMHS